MAMYHSYINLLIYGRLHSIINSIAFISIIIIIPQNSSKVLPLIPFVLSIPLRFRNQN